MLFPVSEVEVAPVIPVLVALIVSFFTSIGGISGAFLLLPFQVSVLGYNNPSVSATTQFYNLVAIPGGVLRYIKEKRMIWPLVVTLTSGTLPGVVIGSYIRIVLLPNPKPFKLFVACILMCIGVKLIIRLLDKNSSSKKLLSSKTNAVNCLIENDFTVRLDEFSLKQLCYFFQGTRYGVSTKSVIILSFAVGLLGGIYGIGGGAIIAPFLISWYRLPVHSISGATLLNSLITSGGGVASFTLFAYFFPDKSISPDLLLGLLFGIGGALGTYLGARCQKYFHTKVIEWILVLIIISIASKYIVDFL